MSDATLDSVFLVLCDWRGHCAWCNIVDSPLHVGDLVWKNLVSESQHEAQAMLSRVVALRETQCVEVTNQKGERFRTWMWPLSSPDIAVCVLGVRVPVELQQLTERELDCLQLLGQGIETREIARQLEVSLSTVHTHLKRSREKLNLPSVEALISFAARHCYPTHKPLHREPE